MRVKVHLNDVATVYDDVGAIDVDHLTQGLALDVGPGTLIEISAAEWTRLTVERQPILGDAAEPKKEIVRDPHYRFIDLSE